jgi:hypothetical protein
MLTPRCRAPASRAVNRSTRTGVVKQTAIENQPVCRPVSTISTTHGDPSWSAKTPSAWRAVRPASTDQLPSGCRVSSTSFSVAYIANTAWERRLRKLTNDSFADTVVLKLLNEVATIADFRLAVLSRLGFTNTGPAPLLCGGHPLSNRRTDNSFRRRLHQGWLGWIQIRHPFRGPAAAFTATRSKSLYGQDRFLKALPFQNVGRTTF